jgi:hypothetical protein
MPSVMAKPTFSAQLDASAGIRLQRRSQPEIAFEPLQAKSL